MGFGCTGKSPCGFCIGARAIGNTLQIPGLVLRGFHQIVSLGGPSLHLVQLIPHNRRLAKKDGTSDHRNKNSSFRQPNHSSLKA